jgi:hypothetical protein
MPLRCGRTPGRGIRGISSIVTSFNIVIPEVFLVVVQGNPASDGAIAIGSLATILTVAGVTIYVLGLVGLAATIRLRLARDIPMAWYAVSLLPRTIVAGQGIRIWLGWPISVTATIALLMILSKALELKADTTLSILFYGVILVFFLYLVVFVWKAWRSDIPGAKDLAFVRNRRHAFTRFAARILAIGLYTLAALLAASVIALGSVILMVAGILVFTGLSPAGYARGFLKGFFGDLYWIVGGVPYNHMELVGIITLFVGGFIVGLPSALLKKPPLPRVQLTKKPGDSAGVLPDSMTCNLVTHSSDGLWHVFDDTGQLWAIPDDEVLLARIPGDPTTTSAAQGSPEGDENAGNEEKG